MTSNLIIFNIKTDSNDDVLGITTPWINALAKQFSYVYVISTSTGNLKIDHNVRVFSLGGESNNKAIQKLLNFYIILIKVLFQSGVNSSVFAHMTPLYLILASPFLKLLRIPSVLWYAHKKVSFTLMVASILASRIATIDRNSFNFKVKTKRYYIGHGITYPDFYLKSKPTRLKYELVMVGRISAIKRIEFLIKALSILKEKLNIDFNLNLYGDTITKKDLVYKNKLKNLVLACGISSNVIFHGSKPNNEIANHIMLCDLAFNLSVDGGMDKAGLEAMAIGIPLIYTNSSYNKIFIDLNMDYSKYYVSKLSYSKLADKIEPFLKNQHKNIRLPKLLISHIRTEYSVDALISRLTPILKMK